MLSSENKFFLESLFCLTKLNEDRSCSNLKDFPEILENKIVDTSECSTNNETDELESSVIVSNSIDGLCGYANIVVQPNEIENFSFNFQDSYLNCEENYQDYVIDSLKSMKNFKDLHLEKEIESRKISLPQSNKKVLILDLDETLIHSIFADENKESAKITSKLNKFLETHIISFEDELTKEEVKATVVFRPGVKKFLNNLKEIFDIGIFTASIQDYADSVINILDPNGDIFKFRLYRQSCIKVGRCYLKDLSIIENRDLKDIILVDNSIYSFANQLSNGILIYSFYSDHKDKELEKYSDYLIEYLAKCNDIRFVNEQVFSFKSTIDQMTG